MEFGSAGQPVEQWRSYAETHLPTPRGVTNDENQSEKLAMAKVLLVEDMEMNRDMLSRRLEKQGFEVVTAEDGQEAVDRAKEHTPDIILMDINLPVMDGWEATKSIKECARTKHIPIIALTAHALTKSRDTSIEVGCDEYETKPVDFKRLVGKIEALIHKSHNPQ